jgi:AcrR family transcriptional regulator
MIRSAMKLQRMHGVSGTAFADVLADSGAPRGSIYHHFPAGRGQLAEAATTYGAGWIAERLEEMLADGDPIAALDAFVAMWIGIVVEEDMQAGCAVAAGALDPAPDSAARKAARAGFRKWESLLVAAFARAGVQPGRAESLAVTCIAAVEGALILVRAEGELRPLELVAERLRELLEAERDRLAGSTVTRTIL